jgi:hypothetical protein
MASSAPHSLAEAICELAAPPQEPTYLRLQAYHGDTPSFAVVVLHLRPRHHAAGLEIAVHCAVVEEEELVYYVDAAEAGVLYAVEQTAAGIEAFVQDLITTGSWEYEGDTNSLRLYTTPDAANWSKVDLQLCAATAVHASRQQGVRLSFPPPFIVSARGTICSAAVHNGSDAYNEEQQALMQQPHQRPRGILPDSKEVFQRTFRALRDSAMQSLASMLASMLRQACLFRGSVPVPPPAPAAEAAAADPPPDAGGV